MNPERAVHDSLQARFVSVRIVAIYVVVSGLWIAFSDRLLAGLVSDPALLTNLQTLKGWLFVAASAGILYWLIYRSTAALRRSHQALRGSLDEQQHPERVQAATYRISEMANRVGDLQELFQSIHRIIGELMPAQNLYIALYDAETNLLSFPYFVDECDETSAPH